jgi:hypothetical protein
MIMAGRRHHTPEQIVRQLHTADQLLANGGDLAAVCRELDVSEQTYCLLAQPVRRAEGHDARRLKKRSGRPRRSSGCSPTPS